MTSAPSPHAAAPYWSEPIERVLAAQRTTREGLSSDEAARRLREVGPNTLAMRDAHPLAAAVLRQVRNPLAWLLLFAAVVSAVARVWTDASVITAIMLLGSALSVAQEWRAGRAIDALRARIAARAQVVRGGAEITVPAAEIVPGDVLALSAGALIPADAVLIEARDCFVIQAVLTGESLPVEKLACVVPAEASLVERTNVVFQGTSVRSGFARAVVTRTGPASEYGAVAARLALRPPETEFDRGIRQFGYMLTRVMGALVLVTFAASTLRHQPPVESVLFAIALAVGLAPEMLPAILSITLAHGARAMAERGVVVRRLSAIENLGSMDVLCTDKTGTLTEGTMELERAVDAEGRDADGVLRLAFWNAALETGLGNPLDDAIRARGESAGLAAPPTKVDEVPYDFTRKRLTVAVRRADDASVTLVTKGALERVLDVCKRARDGAGAEIALDDAQRAAVLQRFHGWSADGVRVIGVATRAMVPAASYAVRDECEMTFEGFLLFRDPAKRGAADAVRDLQRLGVAVKIVSGDHRDVVRHLASQIGLTVQGVLGGREIAALGDEALWHAAERTTIFAEVDPNQKERIILALRKTGHVVGYMGDGINDAPALHAADVGISVDSAVDVARDAADFVLLQRDLGTLRAGVEEGRATFVNTLKYIMTTESANFGNMLSMAAASFALPFLPLLAPQILLNNFLSDVPAMAIARDAVDPELLAGPQRWDLKFVRRFMVLFGLVSSCFDVATFFLLAHVFASSPAQFRTGWFVESLATELGVALVVRTRRPFWRSKPGRALWVSTAVMGAVTLALPYTPVGTQFQFEPMPAKILASVLGVTAAYVAAVELLKRTLYARLGNARHE